MQQKSNISMEIISVRFSQKDSIPGVPEELADQMVAIREKFFVKLPDRISELALVTGNADWKAIDEFGHEIKGTSACLGLEDISKIGVLIQSAANAKSVESLDTCLRDLRAIYTEWDSSVNH
jgi:HPt (histidine-containing phosphotransfer) domain-containing protein